MLNQTISIVESKGFGSKQELEYVWASNGNIIVGNIYHFPASQDFCHFPDHLLMLLCSLQNSMNPAQTAPKGSV